MPLDTERRHQYDCAALNPPRLQPSRSFPPANLTIKTMHASLLPILGTFIWVGGGSAGLVLLILVLVLLLR
jgi:hypothetical protein